MSIKTELRRKKAELLPLSLYERFEYVIIVILTALISIVVVAAVWKLSLEILTGLILSGKIDPSDYSAFQQVFGMILTVIIALEFKKSLLVVAAGQNTVVQIRSVVVIALLAVCLKVIIIDRTKTDALYVFSLAAAILALGIVYWLVGVRDKRPADSSQR